MLRSQIVECAGGGGPVFCFYLWKSDDRSYMQRAQRVEAAVVVAGNGRMFNTTSLHQAMGQWYSREIEIEDCINLTGSMVERGERGSDGGGGETRGKRDFSAGATKGEK